MPYSAVGGLTELWLGSRAGIDSVLALVADVLLYLVQSRLRSIELDSLVRILPQLPRDQFPYLNESAAGLVAAGYDPTEEFLFGLDLILTALEPLRTSA